MNKNKVAQGLCAVFTYISSRDISFFEKFLVVGFVLLYIVFPIDLIPDVPFVGWIDDIGVSALFVAFCNYRVNNLSASESAKEVIDAPPAGEKNDSENKRINTSSNSSFSFHTKGKTSGNTGKASK